MTTTQEHAVPFEQRQFRISFRNPPVAEVAAGFYFEKIEGWNVLHQGALWERFQAKYPETEFFAPILDFAPKLPIQLNITENIMSSIPIRVGFVDRTKTHLVQTQNGLLIHNWRKTPDHPEYDRYESIRAYLNDDWRTFRSYLGDKSFNNPTVTRCQIDYFNHLVRGEAWQDLSELPSIFTAWRGLPQLVKASKLQAASFSVSYAMGRGTINIVVQPAIRSNDGKELIQFTLSSSVPPTGSSDDELFSCLDECHDNAARAFVDFTTDAARERWNQK
jgi:uncharacterized protein (TIGR04255 family)